MRDPIILSSKWGPLPICNCFPQKAVGARSPNNRHRNSLLVGLTRSPLAGPSSFLGLIYFFARLQTICLARQLKNWIWAKQFSVFHFSSSFTAWLNLWTISTHLAGTSITASCFCSTTQVKPYIQIVKSSRRNQGDSSKLHTPSLWRICTTSLLRRAFFESARCEDQLVAKEQPIAVDPLVAKTKKLTPLQLFFD